MFKGSFFFKTSSHRFSNTLYSISISIPHTNKPSSLIGQSNPVCHTYLSHTLSLIGPSHLFNSNRVAFIESESHPPHPYLHVIERYFQESKQNSPHPSHLLSLCNKKLIALLILPLFVTHKTSKQEGPLWASLLKITVLLKNIVDTNKLSKLKPVRYL